MFKEYEMILREILNILNEARRALLNKPRSLKDWWYAYIVHEYRRIVWQMKESRFLRIVELSSRAFPISQPDLTNELSWLYDGVEEKMNNFMDYEVSDEYQDGHYEIGNFTRFRRIVVNVWLNLFKGYLHYSFPELKMVFAKAWDRIQYIPKLKRKELAE